MKITDGTFVEAPLEDEALPRAPQWPVPHHPCLGFAGLKELRRGDVGDSTVLRNTQTPKRSGDNLLALSPQRICTFDGDQESMNPHGKSSRDAASLFQKIESVERIRGGIESPDFPS